LSGGTEKNRENKLSTVDLRFDIWTLDLLTMEQECYPHDLKVR
jgi:hypothetical protein